MQPTADTDYKSLFSQLIKKQMLVLGPDITLAKVRNVIGITVDLNGDVQKIEGDPQVLLQGLINQFVELSGMIVKKTMESILTSYPGMMAMAATSAFGGVQVSSQTQPAVATQQAVTQTQDPQSLQITQPQVQASSADISVSNTSKNIVREENKVQKEPPPMASMDLESLNVNPKPVEKEENFTQDEMSKLNKALDDLSKAPLASEQLTIK